MRQPMVKTHLEHVGDHGASALDVDTAVAVVLADQRLAGSWGLLLATTLEGQTQSSDEKRRGPESSDWLRCGGGHTHLAACSEEAALAVPLSWEWLQVLVQENQNKT